MIQEKIRQYRKTIQENQNKEYTVFLSAFFVLFTVFLTSRLWLPSDVKIQNSEIGSEKNVTGGVVLVLNSWQYNMVARYMEVSFTIQGADETQDYKFIPTAHTNLNKATPMNTAIAYCSNDLLTIQIKDVPKKWQVISLWVKGQDVLNDGDSVTSSEDSDDLEGANFFCDSRRVLVNQTLEPQSALNYALQSIYNEMKEVREDISSTNQKISAANAQISQLNFDISSLKENQKYQTQDEIQKSDSAIQAKTSQIDNLKNTILSDQAQIKTDQEKLKKLNQKMDDTKSGKLSPVSGSSSSNVSSSVNFSSNSTTEKSGSKVSVD